MSGVLPIVEERRIKNEATELMALEDMIKNHVALMDKLKDELKQKKEMFEDSFNNNPVFREHTEKVKSVTKEKSVIRQQIAKQPSVASLNQEIKDLKFDLNERKKTLSDLLVDYKGKTGATQLELFNGQVMEIVQEAKLVRRNTRYNP